MLFFGKIESHAIYECLVRVYKSESWSSDSIDNLIKQHVVIFFKYINKIYDKVEGDTTKQKVFIYGDKTVREFSLSEFLFSNDIQHLMSMSMHII